VVRAPKGQTSVFYDVEAARLDGKRQAKKAREALENGDSGVVEVEVRNTTAR
jgi:hypothetical protein